MTSLRPYGLLLALLLLLPACSGMGRIAHDTPQEAFQKGEQELAEGDHWRAIQYFQGVFDYGRSNEYADDAQFQLGMAYFEDEQYILAANAFNRFAQLYRTDERIPEAEYMRALAYYEQSPIYTLDQTPTENAIQYFQVFLNRHPQSERADDAQQRIAELRNKLAHKQYAAGEMYERRQMWEAAAVTFEQVFDQYPDTKWAERGLFQAMENYYEYAVRSVEGKRDERLQKAMDSYERLIQLFPESDLLKRAEGLYDEIRSEQEALAQR